MITLVGFLLITAGVAFLGPVSLLGVVAIAGFYVLGVPAAIVLVYLDRVDHMELLKAGALFAASIYAVLLVFMGLDLGLGVAVPYPVMVIASLGTALALIYDRVAVREIITA